MTKLAILAVSAGALAWWGLTPPPGHTPLHVNCPPGSHATPESKNSVARKLTEARAQSLAARSLTADHPTAVPQPKAPK